jgi:Iodothyronine deiodinase
MEKMYQDYKDIAEFRLVYIKEAHALDSTWPVGYAKEMGIKQHTTYSERCSVATKLLSDKNLNIPTLADDMNDTANNAYKGWPDRIFLVRKDGKLAVAGKRGPWGFKPSLDAANTWLASYKDTGREPPIQTASADSGSKKSDHDKTAEKLAIVDPKVAAVVIGSWEMKTEYQGGQIPATMSVKLDNGHLVGTWASQGMEMKMASVAIKGDVFSFMRTMGAEGPSLSFTGKIDGDKIAGKYKTPFGEMKCAGTRKKSTDASD